MPSGDAQRVWFPELIGTLKSSWSESMTWGELADLCSRLTEEREELRRSRGIRPPLIRCPKCGAESRSDISGLSIRSALFALRKAGVFTEADLKHHDLDWKKYQASHHLDPYGKKIPASRGADRSGSAKLRCIEVGCPGVPARSEAHK